MDYQVRVIFDKAELDAKILKLKQFTDSDTNMSTVDDAEKNRLFAQLEYMRQYSAVLGVRILNF